MALATAESGELLFDILPFHAGSSFLAGGFLREDIFLLHPDKARLAGAGDAELSDAAVFSRLEVDVLDIDEACASGPSSYPPMGNGNSSTACAAG